MPDGGAIINGRDYTKHALERMSPDIHKGWYKGVYRFFG